MKLSGWLRAGTDSGSGKDRGEAGEREEGGDSGTAQGASEQAQRERLARARRERAAKARAVLASKARDEGEEEASRTNRSSTEDSRRKRTRERAARDEASSNPRTSSSGSRRQGAAKAGAGFAAALKRGAGETRGRTKAAAPGFAKSALLLAGAFFAIFFDLLAVVLNVAIAAWRLLAGPLRGLVATVRRVADAASRLLSPARVMALVVAGALVLLALSQFADYRSISVGTDNYADGIQTVAPAPEKVRDVTGSVHSYAFVPIAVVSLLLLVLAARGRWRLCRLIALSGLAAIVVSLIVDRPAGLDPGDTALAYDGVRATLLGGFYAQLFAGLLVTIAALLLGRELRLAANGEPVRRSRRPQSSRHLFRRNSRVEGARA